MWTPRCVGGKRADTMAAGRSSVSGLMQQPEAPSSSDSPPPHGSEDEEQHGGAAAPHDPEWTEERFRVDRKKLELMLLGKGSAHELNLNKQKMLVPLIRMFWLLTSTLSRTPDVRALN